MRRGREPGEAVKIGASTFASGGANLQYYLPWLVVGNYDSVGHTFTLVPKVIGVNDLPNLQVTLAPQETESYPVYPFQSISIDTATANAIYFYSDQAIASLSVTKIAGNQTIIEGEGGNGTQAATLGTVLKTGVNTIPVGARVDYMVSLSSLNTNSALQIISHTLTTAAVQIFGGQTLSGSFYKGIADTLDVEIFVTGAPNEPYAFFWQATTP